MFEIKGNKNNGRARDSYKWIYTPKIAKIGLKTDAEYVANSVSVVVNVQQCSTVYYMGMLYLHNDMFLLIS